MSARGLRRCEVCKQKLPVKRMHFWFRGIEGLKRWCCNSMDECRERLAAKKGTK